MPHGGVGNALTKRKPWPYDAVLGTLGVLLKPDEDGQLIGRRTATLSPQILDPGYGTVDPRLEIAYPYRQQVLGMGQRVQPPGTKITRRYYFDYNCDSSINGNTILGPNFSAETIKAGSPVKDFVYGRYSGGMTVFAMCDRYLMVRTGDNAWTQIGDLGAGNSFNQAITWAPPSYTANQRYRIWFTWNTGAVGGTSRIAYYDDTAGFVIASAGASGGPPNPRWITANRDELWTMDDHNAYRLLPQGDPLVSASWTKFYLGNEHYVTTYANVNDDVPYFYKENSVYTVDATGEAHDLYPGFRHSPNTRFGALTTTWLRHQYIPGGDGFYKLSANGGLEVIDAELMLGNDSIMQGRAVASAGHNTWFLYYLSNNERTGDCFLTKYGAWIESEGDNNPQLMEYVDVHHGGIAVWESKQGSACRIIQFTSADNPRLYVGFADGTCQWTNLPRNNPDPTSDPNCTFCAEGWHYQPDNTGGYAADTKLYRGFAIHGPRLDTEQKVALDYRLDQNTEWLPFNNADGAQQEFTRRGQRLDFPSQAQITGKTLGTRMHLSTANPAFTPAVEGMVIYQQVRPPFLLDYEFIVQARARNKRLDGSIEHRPPDYIRARIQAMIASGQTVLCIMPWGVTEELSFSDYTESLYSEESSYGPEWQIRFKGTQFKPETAPGSIARAQWTYGELQQYTYGQLQVIL